jgi:hypothetical protein
MPVLPNPDPLKTIASDKPAGSVGVALMDDGSYEMIVVAVHSGGVSGTIERYTLSHAQALHLLKNLWSLVSVADVTDIRPTARQTPDGAERRAPIPKTV